MRAKEKYQALTDFNSIKVRLEQHGTVEGNERPARFQFHKGTIRTLLLHRPRRQQIPFQFHKGTIRTRSLRAFRIFRHPFQFHKGTIRTRTRRRNEEYPSNFNSIKVRLELWWIYTLGDSYLFQFHKGTIRTIYLFHP